MAIDMGVNKLAISFLITTDLEPIDSADEKSREGHREELSQSTVSVASTLGDAPVQKSSWRWKCSECSVRFPNGAKMLYHKMKHCGNDQTLHACDECQIAFPKACQLRNHVNFVHLKQRQHSCDRCPKSFFSKKDLVKHAAAVHDGLRPYPCGTCGKRFGLQQHLRRHVRTAHQ